MQFTQTIYLFISRQLKEHTGGEDRNLDENVVKAKCGEEAKKEEFVPLSTIIVFHCHR